VARLGRVMKVEPPWIPILGIGILMLAALCYPLAPILSAAPSSSHPMARVVTGAERLAETNFGLLAGKRVGLIVNQTATVGSAHLADLVRSADNVTLAAIFVPEHGGKGDMEAGKAVRGGLDKSSRIPTHSLYGATRKPTKAMLRDVDVLVFDMQDIGVRFYTFISTMGLAMQAAAEAGIPFVVLDRPNPLGGQYVSGFVTEPPQVSFVGQYAIPTVHGLTVGELAKLIKGQHLLPGLENLQLEVVAMKGWERWMRWPDTQLAWQRTSPNIVDFETALVYAGVGLFEATSVSDGRGTLKPFTHLGASWVDGNELARTLNSIGLPGVKFEPTRFTPRAIAAMASRPLLQDQTIEGIRIVVTDHDAYLPVESGVQVLWAFHRHAQARHQKGFVARKDWLDKMAGSQRLYRMLEVGASAENVIEAWKAETAEFNRVRGRYLLY
jgi:uncharacterized protein YbbC (DUF1343 family)